MHELAAMFKALADETRLSMLALLLERRELCVCDFEGVLGISQSKASRHLRYLLHAGFVDDRRGGAWVYYRLAANLSADHRAVVRSLRRLLGGVRVDQLRTTLERWLDAKGREAATCASGKERTGT